MQSQNATKLKQKNHNKRYKLTDQQLEALTASHGGHCCLCNKEFDSTKKEPFIDHSHASGNVRSLLCNSCNTKLGKYENPKINSAPNALADIYIMLFDHPIERVIETHLSGAFSQWRERLQPGEPAELPPDHRKQEQAAIEQAVYNYITGNLDKDLNVNGEPAELNAFIKIYELRDKITATESVTQEHTIVVNMLSQEEMERHKEEIYGKELSEEEESKIDISKIDPHAN